MKNALSYYYHLFPDTLIYHNNEYSFVIQNHHYRFVPVTRTIEEVKEIYKLQSNLLLNRYFAEIILNQFHEVFTPVKQKYYILVRDKISNRQININDILNSYQRVVSSEYPLLNRSDWVSLWIKKIDYFEYQKSYIKHKYPILYASLDYYVGLAENAISYVGEALAHLDSIPSVVISRRRVSAQMGIHEYYFPLNIVVDYRVRDMAEYLKSLFYYDYYDENVIEQLFLQVDYTKTEWELLMGRMMFPTFYFDCYENIINGVFQEKKIISILKRNEDYEYFLKMIYFQLKKFSMIARIDWLDK